MKKKILYSLIALSVFSCHSRDKNKDSEDLQTKILSNLPEYIQKIDNLTVHSFDVDSSKSVLLKKTLTFTPTVQRWFNFTGRIAVDDSNRVYIADQHSIKVFDPNGEYITTLGREGRGPGEFDNMTTLGPKIRSGLLYVYDDVLKRINVFDLNLLQYSRMIRLNPQDWDHVKTLRGATIDDFYILSDSTFLIKFNDPTLADNKGNRFSRYFLMDNNGKIFSNEILKQPFVNFSPENNSQAPPAPGNLTSLTFPSSKSSVLKVDSDGIIYTAWTGRILIKKYHPNGKYKNAFYYPYEKSELNEDKVIKAYKYNQQLFKRAQNIDLPNTWPAINYFIVDDMNRIWISIITDDETSYEWWVLTNEGKVLARFKWPGNKLRRHQEFGAIVTVKNGYLYAIKEEARKLVRYRVEIN